LIDIVEALFMCVCYTSGGGVMVYSLKLCGGCL
jgi:hypothetical protein